MTRRDIIILAVLVNAGLLAILFMLAINTDDDKVSESIEITQPIVVVQENEKPLDLLPTANETQILAERTGDEVDNALKDFADSPPTQQPMIVEEEVLPYAAAQDSDAIQSTETSVPEQIVPEEPKDNTKYVEVTVKKGDMLEKIARANGTTVSAIKEANQLKNERLSIGQVLRVPVSTNKKTDTSSSSKSTSKKSSSESTAAPKSSSKSSAKADSKSEPQYYTVKNGDNPWKIAKQFQVKVDDLLKLNNMSEEKARNMKVGDKIRVR